MQIILRLLLAVIHVLYNIIHWSRLQWKLRIEGLFSSKSSTEETQILNSIRELTNLPRHLVVILGHEEVSFPDLIRIVGWCVITGIPCVSFYDHSGFLQRNEKVIEKKFVTERPDLEQHIIWNSQSCVKSNKNGVNGFKHKVKVQLLSYNDGKGRIVSLAQDLAKAVTSGTLQRDEINIDLLKDKLKFDDIPDPDLGVVCGQTFSTYGFLPWHIRITEFIRIPSHHNILVQDFADLLKRYSKCEQRNGK